MLSRLTGAYQSEKASQEQVSDKAAAGITALAKLVQIVGKDCGTQVKAVAAGYRQLALFFSLDCLQISAVYVFTIQMSTKQVYHHMLHALCCRSLRRQPRVWLQLPTGQIKHNRCFCEY